MHRTRTNALLLTAAAATITVLAVTPAHAVQRTHVSAAIGVDTNTATGCTPVAPCRTFQAAMTVTDPNGEVVVLDSGGYGAVTITHSLALIAPKGVYAGISVFPGATGVTIATPGINVVLRGLTINGQGGDNGIRMTAGTKLTVENCVISNLGRSGIFVGGISAVRVTDTIVRDNAGIGISMQGGSATITRVILSGNLFGISIRDGNGVSPTSADIADSTIDGNRIGIFAGSGRTTAILKVSVRNSRILRNVEQGLLIQVSSGGVSSLSASNNIISNNLTGIEVLGPRASVWASGNTLSDNAVGFKRSDFSRFESAGNNALRNNGTDTSGPIVLVGTR